MPYKCPHCSKEIAEGWSGTEYEDGRRRRVDIFTLKCPLCQRTAVKLQLRHGNDEPQTLVVHPLGMNAVLPPEVPEKFAAEYREAAAILALSPKASAALSRRLMQQVLRDVGGATKRTLKDQIEELTVPGKLPDELSQALHRVRVIGNFGAHPIKSTNTGEIAEVEPHEAEWNLETLDELFHHYFVVMEQQRRRRELLNAKLERFDVRPIGETGGDT